MAQLIGPGELIVVSWENFRKNFRAYAEFVVWIVALSLVQWLILIAVQASVPGLSERLMLYALLSIPGSLAFLVVTAAMIDLTITGISDKKIDIRESLYHGFQRLLPLLWVSILTSVMIFLGLIILVIPALIFFVWYKFAPYQTVAEKTGGWKALDASRNLVTGRWWSVLLRVLVPMLFFSIISSLAIQLIYLFIGATLGDIRMFFGETPMMADVPYTHTLITSIVPQTINGFALALIIGADIALWLDLKRKG